MISFYYCGCYLSHNIYIEEYDTHFKYLDMNQFLCDYNKILPKLGCDTENKRTHLIDKITEEIDRRKSLEKRAQDRKSYLKEFYKPLNDSIYILEEKFLHPNFIELVNTAKSLNLKKTLQLLDIISEKKKLNGFAVFKEDFCEQLTRELNHYTESDMPKEKPNSMNKYGVLLDELGFHDHFSLVLREKYLDPLAEVLFPEWRGKGLDSHKIFSVRYKMNEDLELGYHYDNSEVTLNVCLGQIFEGGELYFGDMLVHKSTCMLVSHTVGYGILHRGQQLHGALPITSGERQNLILWMRSSSVRNERCPMCNTKPTKLLHSVGYGDGFTLKDESSTQICNIV